MNELIRELNELRRRVERLERWAARNGKPLPARAAVSTMPMPGDSPPDREAPLDA